MAALVLLGVLLTARVAKPHAKRHERQQNHERDAGVDGQQAAASNPPAGLPAGLVDAAEAIPDLLVDLRYATADNVVGRALYPPGTRCLLRPAVVEALARAATTLRAAGFRLKVYDCYRPLSAQWELWNRFPRPGYVADPRKGGPHNRGAAVDVTLVDANGRAVEMPTDFDSFTRAAHHGYSGGSETSRRNRETLRKAMEDAGLRKNRMEWWHYQLWPAPRGKL